MTGHPLTNHDGAPIIQPDSTDEPRAGGLVDSLALAHGRTRPGADFLSASTINIGLAFDCFLPTWHKFPVGIGRPPWRMHAALLT